MNINASAKKIIALFLLFAAAAFCASAKTARKSAAGADFLNSCEDTDFLKMIKTKTAALIFIGWNADASLFERCEAFKCIPNPALDVRGGLVYGNARRSSGHYVFELWSWREGDLRNDCKIHKVSSAAQLPSLYGMEVPPGKDAGEYALGCFGIDLKFYDSVFYVKENLREGVAEFEPPVRSDVDIELSEYMEIENYINSDESEIPSPAELERKYFDKSESKKDECFKIYAHILRHKNPKCEKEREELNEIFQNLNSFFSLLAGGGIGFGHESERICAYVEYELFHLQKNRLDEKMALSDSAKNDFEYILWTVGTQNVNMQQKMLDSGYLKYAKTMHEAIELMSLIELQVNNRFYNECANRYINQVMRKKLGEYFEK